MATQISRLQWRGRPALLALGAATILGISCRRDLPVQPNEVRPAFEILDAVHNAGNDHFFFLPPMATRPIFSGTFDASLPPVVEICEWTGTACILPLLARFTTTTGPGSETVRLDLTDELYVVNWRTDQFRLDPSKPYRVRVLVTGTELGHADVDIVATASELKSANSSVSVPVLNGRTLPIKFRIERGAVFIVGAGGGTITALDGQATIVFPPGALSEDRGITVRSVTQQLQGAPPAIVGPVLLVQPDGLTFSRRVQVILSYTAETADPQDLSVFQYLPDQQAVLLMPSAVDLVTQTVRTTVTHFSLLFLGEWTALPRRTITYQVSGDLLTVPDFLTNVGRAFSVWEYYLTNVGVHFELDESTLFPDIEIRYGTLPDQVLGRYDPERRLLRKAVLINRNEAFFTTEEQRQRLETGTPIDTKNGYELVLQHEIGHALGLRHFMPEVCDVHRDENLFANECNQPPVMAALSDGLTPFALRCEDLHSLAEKYAVSSGERSSIEGRCGTRISLQEGDHQVATANSAVPIQPSVRVTDANGQPVGGATVLFRMPPGQGGSVAGGVATTDDRGVAAVRRWALGAEPGSYALIAQVRVDESGYPKNIEYSFAATAVATPSAAIFASSGQGSGSPPSDLYLVEVSAAGRDLLIGRVRTADGFEPVTTDLAVSPGGSLWAVSFDRLYQIDKATGIATEVGALGVFGANALAFDANGALFGATSDGSFFQIDTRTGRASVLGSFGSGFGSWGDIAFAPDGRLFGTVLTTDGIGLLVLIDRTNGRATPVSPSTGIGFANVWGLTFIGNDLFGLTTNLANGTGQLIKIDTSAGTAVFIRNLSFEAFGAGTAARTGGGS